MSKKVAKIFADKMIKMIEDGSAGGRWIAPWDKFASDLPINIVSKNHYNGINIFLLWAAGFASPYWGTMKQWNQAGAKIRKGEKPTQIIFYTTFESKTETDSNGDPVLIPAMRYYKVWNANQVEGWEAPETDNKQVLSKDDVRHRCDALIAATGAEIHHGGNRACYIPSKDCILLPEFNSFKNADAYYQTAFHELAHWTGHKSRMNRSFKNRFGDHAYALEELLAEMSAGIICAMVGIETHTRMDHAKYIKGWLEALKEKPQCLVSVASRASKVVDFLLEYENQKDQAAA
jgi:antirestriction protein ArdC